MWLLPLETEPPGGRIPDSPVRIFPAVQQVGFRSGIAGFGQSHDRLPPHQGLRVFQSPNEGFNHGGATGVA